MIACVHIQQKTLATTTFTARFRNRQNLLQLKPFTKYVETNSGKWKKASF